MTLKDFEEHVRKAALTDDEKRLIRLFDRVDMPLDFLPYTREFDGLVREFDSTQTHDGAKRELFRRLYRYRQVGMLPWIPESRSPGDSSAGEDAIVARAIANRFAAEKRDLIDILYTPEFEDVVNELNSRRIGPPLGPNPTWRLLSRHYRSVA
ncbi:MAG: hypothetical protein ACKVS9_07065 [Phycisphaerae bacterium]